MTPEYIWPSVDDSSKQELQDSGRERGCLSPTLSIITRWNRLEMTSLSISHVCERPLQSAEKKKKKKKKKRKREKVLSDTKV